MPSLTQIIRTVEDLSKTMLKERQRGFERTVLMGNVSIAGFSREKIINFIALENDYTGFPPLALRPPHPHTS